MSLIDDAIGLVPAAGRATRLGELAGSKELLPLAFPGPGYGDELRIRPVCTTLFGAFRDSGIRRAVVVLRAGKWDIIEYLGDGRRVGMDLVYALMRHPHGAPFTLDAAHPFVKDSPVALGFPDVLFEPSNAFRDLFARLEESGADVALGLFPVVRPESTDTVTCESSGRVAAIQVKPRSATLGHAWGIAAWRPPFTAFLHSWVADRLSSGTGDALQQREWYVGQVFQDALAGGMHIEGVFVSRKPFLDIGTPASLAEAWRQVTAT